MHKKLYSYFYVKRKLPWIWCHFSKSDFKRENIIKLEVSYTIERGKREEGELHTSLKCLGLKFPLRHIFLYTSPPLFLEELKNLLRTHWFTGSTTIHFSFALLQNKEVFTLFKISVFR